MICHTAHSPAPEFQISENSAAKVSAQDVICSDVFLKVLVVIGILGFILAGIGAASLIHFNFLASHYAIAMVAVGALATLIGGICLYILLRRANEKQQESVDSNTATKKPIESDSKVKKPEPKVEKSESSSSKSKEPEKSDSSSSKSKGSEKGSDRIEISEKSDLKETPIGAKPEFLEGSAAQNKICAQDAYLTKMTAYDRRVRLKKEGTAEEFAAFYKTQILSWSDEEKEAIQRDLAAIFAKLTQLKIHLPATLTFIKTTGKEELAGTGAYCRQGSIVFCGSYRPHLLAHELFHIISQYNPEKRDLLYRMLGFKPCTKTISFPPNAIINPDSLYDPYFIEITHQGKKVCGVPFDRISDPDHASFASLEHVLLLEDGTTIPFQRNPSFLEQVGENTAYTDSAEEILADNFAHWVEGKKAKTAWVLDEMVKILSMTTETTKTSKDATAKKVDKKAAILFASISANPAHYGHLAAAATAAKEISKENKVKIYFSICPQSYLATKMKDKQAKIPTFEERQHQLETLLVDAKGHGMFPDMEVEFWNDQANGFSDHPESYARLVKQHQGVAKVIFVAGSDLCRRMGNWTHSIEHAVVVSRGEGDPESYSVKDNGSIVSFHDTKTKAAFVKAENKHNFSRILLDNAYPQFTSLSSTAIREGKMANTFV